MDRMLTSRECSDAAGVTPLNWVRWIAGKHNSIPPAAPGASNDTRYSAINSYEAALWHALYATGMRRHVVKALLRQRFTFMIRMRAEALGLPVPVGGLSVLTANPKWRAFEFTERDPNNAVFYVAGVNGVGYMTMDAPHGDTLHDLLKSGGARIVIPAGAICAGVDHALDAGTSLTALNSDDYRA